MTTEYSPGSKSAAVAALSLPRAAVVAGAGMVLMAVAAMLSFPFIESVLVSGDAAATASNVAQNETWFRAAIAGLLLVAALDVVVAWALYVFFRPANANLSLLAMLLRVVYAGVFVVALHNLSVLADLAGGSTMGLATSQLHALVLSSAASFEHTWSIGLAIFGVHLLALGALAVDADYVPTAVGALVVVAGLGYLADSLGGLLSSQYALELALFTFVGELVLLAWLLYRGRTLPADAGRADAPPARTAADLSSNDALEETP